MKSPNCPLCKSEDTSTVKFTKNGTILEKMICNNCSEDFWGKGQYYLKREYEIIHNNGEFVDLDKWETTHPKPEIKCYHCYSRKTTLVIEVKNNLTKIKCPDCDTICYKFMSLEK